ncbi:MAG: rhomboid family intramembrane serine protease [Duncaniella sp.]|nr:rhomboid family intramembrane serine protease [Muribaculum sp.]MCM1255317.1 rhomboid family intramembrane serine protease [Duncaniella sp.]
MGTLDQMRNGFRRATMLMKLIWINIGVFVLLRVIAIVCMLGGTPDFLSQVMHQVQLPSFLPLLATRPWTVVTYMFSQYDVLHILFNMLWFYWFGILFQMVSTSKQMLALYIYGGLGGAIVFLLAYNMLPAFNFANGWLIGSSASVMAIVTATAILMPDMKMNLLFIGDVSLKWIAIATILLVLIGVTGSNAGGEFAHIGGVLAGVWYGLSMKRGRDITKPFNRIIDTFVDGWSYISSINFKSEKAKFANKSSAAPSSTAADYKESSPKIDEEDRVELDEILDKIKKSGYAALTPEERDRLFNVTRRIK